MVRFPEFFEIILLQKVVEIASRININMVIALVKTLAKIIVILHIINALCSKHSFLFLFLLL